MLLKDDDDVDDDVDWIPAHWTWTWIPQWEQRIKGRWEEEWQIAQEKVFFWEKDSNGNIGLKG